MGSESAPGSAGGGGMRGLSIQGSIRLGGADRGALLGGPLEVARCLGSEIRVPAASEIVIEGRFLANAREPEGPFGAKEVGEGATLPVLGAIANAVADATGVRIYDLPITAEKVLRGIKENQAGAAG